MKLHHRLIEREPQLLPGLLARFHDVEVCLGKAVAERLGAGVEDDRPQLVAAVAMSVVRNTTQELYAAGDDPVDVADKMRNAFHALGEIVGTKSDRPSARTLVAYVAGTSSDVVSVDNGT